MDLCAVQEHRWAGSTLASQSRQIQGKNSTYKFFWSGNRSGQGGAGVLIAEKWVSKVVGVERISDRIILIRVRLGKATFTFISVYAPQCGLPEAVKDSFYDLTLVKNLMKESLWNKTVHTVFLGMCHTFQFPEKVGSQSYVNSFTFALNPNLSYQIYLYDPKYYYIVVNPTVSPRLYYDLKVNS